MPDNRSDLNQRAGESLLEWVARVHLKVSDSNEADQVDHAALEVLLGLVPVLLCLVGTKDGDLVAVQKIPTGPSQPVFGGTCTFSVAAGFTITLIVGDGELEQ